LQIIESGMSNVADNIVPEVYVVADNITSPLGRTTSENFEALTAGKTAVKLHGNQSLSTEPFFAAVFNEDEDFFPDKEAKYSRFERLLIASIDEAIKQGNIDPADTKTVFILSSTKGNIGLLETEPDSPELYARISLYSSAKLITAHFGFLHDPIVISNACISGVLGIITGMRLLRAGEYETAVIAGADVMSRFIVSGFQSFQALSKDLCKPFDIDRDGLNLGEGAGTIVLSANKKYSKNIKILGGSVSNDANHISAPSRTGAELAHAISKAMQETSKSASDIGFISAHGTATSYNDEMEAAAITIAGLNHVLLNSLKPNYGHTLGAAGLIESIVSIQSLKQGLILRTHNYEENGVTNKVNVCTDPTPTNAVNFLKTASGFGGCNAAVIFGK
jgi:3-oxoacyl-[acyl-carrier-protein] synthase-1